MGLGASVTIAGDQDRCTNLMKMSCLFVSTRVGTTQRSVTDAYLPLVVGTVIDAADVGS